MNIERIKWIAIPARKQIFADSNPAKIYWPPGWSEDVLSVTTPLYPRGKNFGLSKSHEHVLKTSWKSLKYVLKMSWRRLVRQKSFLSTKRKK